jgi:diadenosine tetraphosphate (Ap4A) HIT family hydrolase
MAAATPEIELYVDDLWNARAVAQVPGWVMLATRRHGDWTWELSDAEAETLGPTLRRLSDAVRAVCGAERVYVIALGENTLHFHLVLLPRSADTPSDLRGTALLDGVAKLADPVEAQKAATALKKALSSS